MSSLFIFIICYVGFVTCPRFKAWISLFGVLTLFLTGDISSSFFLSEVQWNVMGLFIGTLFLAELFMHSRVPAVIAEILVDKSKNVRSALLGIFMLASIISMFVENVAVVLLLAPVAMELCKKLNLSPIKPLILLAMFSNLQGTATLIGDPPSMIFASYMDLGFDDFFFYQGKPSIFFFVQAGAISTLILSFWLFRKQSHKVQLIRIEKVRSWIPSLLLAAFILILACCSKYDKESLWLAGSTAMILAVVGLVWQHLGPRWQPTESLLKNLDWHTFFFLMTLFVLVGAVRQAGWMDLLAEKIVEKLPPHVLTIYLFIVLVTIFISAFVDNVPYLIAMIPVIDYIAAVKGCCLPLLSFSLLITTCLGGNITPIGAAANIVAMSYLEKNGHTLSFMRYVKLGLIFTFFALVPALILLWSVWSEAGF